MKTIDKYRVLERLGTSVFLVRRHRREAALKILCGDDDVDERAIARCFDTACAASALRDPSIAKVHDVGLLSTGEPFIVSEVLVGESLARRLARGPMPLARALELARRITRTLVTAHARGIAHGALQPDSIILIGERAKLVDFGLAHLWAGAPSYASPEQCRAESTFDERSDIYALGCILFEMLAGHAPFESDEVRHLRTSHLMAEPPELLAPAPVRELVAGMLAKDPAKRPSARKVAAKLDELARAPVAPRHAGARWLVAIVVTASIALTSAYAARVELVDKTAAVFRTVPAPH